MNPFARHLQPRFLTHHSIGRGSSRPQDPLSQILEAQGISARRERRREARPRAVITRNMSSGSDDDILAAKLTGGQYTPQDDTPSDDKAETSSLEKLVIVPDEEVGMKADKKHLYSK